MTRKHNHYFKDVQTLTTIDVYRVLTLFNVTDPCIGHAIKKLLVAGGRGAKDLNKDVREAIDTLERWGDMRVEDDKAELIQDEQRLAKARVDFADDQARLKDAAIRDQIERGVLK